MGKRPRPKNVPYNRADRVRDALKEEIGMILLQEMSDPRLSMATVIAVEVSRDIKYARVHVSILGTEDEQAAGLAGLESGAGFIRKRLAERLSMRSLPELRFKLDHSMERAARLSTIFHDLAAEREKFDLPELVEWLPEIGSCMVCAHEHPEGDAIGATLALGLALEEMGKRVVFYNADPVPEVLKFLPGVERIADQVPDVDSLDAVFIIDCGAFDRVGKAMTEALAACKNVVNIDHHGTNERFGRLNLVRADASSTGEIVHEILTALDHEISLPVATNLYTAISTDAGSFQNAAATPGAFRICGELVEMGVDPARIARALYYSYPPRRQLLLGEVLATLRVDADGRIASAVVTREMFERTQTTPGDLEGFVEEVSRVRGIEVALLLREQDDSRIKASMRSKGAVDVARIAADNNGGGHTAAAGCTVEGVDLDGARTELVEQVRAKL